MAFKTPLEQFHERVEGLVGYIALGEAKTPAPNAFNTAYAEDPAPFVPMPKDTWGVGVVPLEGSRLVIIDIDEHDDNSLNAKTQHQLLSRLFGFSSSTLSVETPSGGLHLYYLWPEECELPKNTSLSRYRLGADARGDIPTQRLTGDIRAAGKKGFCVAPGSYSTGRYRVNKDLSIKEVSFAAAVKFNAAYDGNFSALDSADSSIRGEVHPDPNPDGTHSPGGRETVTFPNNEETHALIESVIRHHASTPAALLADEGFQKLDILEKFAHLSFLIQANVGRFYTIFSGDAENQVLFEEIERCRIAINTQPVGSGYRHAPEKKITVDAPEEKTVQKLRMLLDQKFEERKQQDDSFTRMTFLSSRATVFNALVCCHSNDSIYEYWEALGIHKNFSKIKSHSGGVISKNELYKEFDRLTEREGGQHGGPFCLQRRFKDLAPTGDGEPVNVKNLVELRTNSLRHSRGYIAPKVVDITKVYDKVFESHRGRAVNPRIAALAVSLMAGPVQGWMNFGVKNVLISRSFVAQQFGIKDSDAAEVVRLLLRRGILEVSVKQAEGRSASFVVPTKFQHRNLTKKLVAMKMELNDVYVDWASGDFIDPFTDEIHAPVKALRTKSYTSSDTYKFFENLAPDQKAQSFWESLAGGRRMDNAERLTANIEKSEQKKSAAYIEKLDDIAARRNMSCDELKCEPYRDGQIFVSTLQNDVVLKNVNMFRPMIVDGMPVIRPILLEGTMAEYAAKAGTPILVVNVKKGEALDRASALFAAYSKCALVIYADGRVAVRDDKDPWILKLHTNNQPIHRDRHWRNLMKSRGIDIKKDFPKVEQDNGPTIMEITVAMTQKNNADKNVKQQENTERKVVEEVSSSADDIVAHSTTTVSSCENTVSVENQDTGEDVVGYTVENNTAEPTLLGRVFTSSRGYPLRTVDKIKEYIDDVDGEYPMSDRCKNILKNL